MRALRNAPPPPPHQPHHRHPATLRPPSTTRHSPTVPPTRRPTDTPSRHLTTYLPTYLPPHRYEVLAWLGDPQAQLNTAFILRRLASSSGPGLGSLGSLLSIEGAAMAVQQAAKGLQRAAGWAQQQAAGYIGAGGGLNSGGEGGEVRDMTCPAGSTAEECRQEQERGQSQSQSRGQAGMDGVEPKSTASLASARWYYEHAAAQGVAEAARELGHCHFNGWIDRYST